MWNNNLINKALFFATKHHKGQEMPNPRNMPYSAHFTGVALYAIKYASKIENIDWDLLVAVSLMHDTLEDTNATYEEISQNFGTKIADGVLALTKNPNLPKEKQMEDSLKRILKQPKEIAVVKMADRMFNMKDHVPSWDSERLKEYQEEAKLICKYLGFVNPDLEQDLIEEIEKY